MKMLIPNGIVNLTFNYRNVMRFSACTLGGFAPSKGIGRDVI